jgi:hypothetical protein
MVVRGERDMHNEDMVRVNILTLGRLPMGMTGPLYDIELPVSYCDLCVASGCMVEYINTPASSPDPIDQVEEAPVAPVQPEPIVSETVEENTDTVEEEEVPVAVTEDADEAGIIETTEEEEDSTEETTTHNRRRKSKKR